MKINFPKEAWDKLDNKTQTKITEALESTVIAMPPAYTGVVVYYGDITDRALSDRCSIQLKSNQFFRELNPFVNYIQRLESLNVKNISLQKDSDELSTLRKSLSIIKKNLGEVNEKESK